MRGPIEGNEKKGDYPYCLHFNFEFYSLCPFRDCFEWILTECRLRIKEFCNHRYSIHSHLGTFVWRKWNEMIVEFFEKSIDRKLMENSSHYWTTDIFWISYSLVDFELSFHFFQTKLHFENSFCWEVMNCRLFLWLLHHQLQLQTQNLQPHQNPKHFH